MNLIIGAGISGLSIAYLLKKKGEKFIIYDKDIPGGWCRTIEEKGFRFDLGGHFLHSAPKDVLDYLNILNIDFLSIKRNAFVYFRNRLLPYPIQSNLSYMRFYERLFATFSYFLRDKKNPENLEDFFLTKTGRFLTQYFLEGYNKKMWKRPLKKLPPNFLGRFFPQVKLKGQGRDEGYNPVFLYPEKGIGKLIDGIINSGVIVKRGEIQKVLTDRVVVDGKEIKFKRLFLTIPLPEVVKITPFLRNFRNFSFDGVGMKIILMGVKGNLINNAHWIYFPQENLPFTRVGSFTNISKKMSPEGCSSLWMEVPVRNRIPEDFEIISAFKGTGLLGGEILFTKTLYSPYAYPIRDGETTRVIEEIERILKKYNIFISGRFGRWEYNTIVDSIKRAMELV